MKYEEIESLYNIRYNARKRLKFGKFDKFETWERNLTVAEIFIEIFPPHEKFFFGNERKCINSNSTEIQNSTFFITIFSKNIREIYNWRGRDQGFS